MSSEQSVAQTTANFCNAMSSIRKHFTTECTCPSSSTDATLSNEVDIPSTKLTPEQLRVRALNTNFFRIAFMGKDGVPFQ
jgi:hypothetical protein